jgi:hypothetical protein
VAVFCAQVDDQLAELVVVDESKQALAERGDRLERLIAGRGAVRLG